MHLQLAGLGRRPDLNDELAQLADDDLTPARVLAQHRGRWLVARPDDGPSLVPARTRALDAAAGPPVTGDWVALDHGGAIAHVLERRGAIVRHDVGERTASQPLAANVEVALIVEAFPEPNLRRAERLLALTTAGGVRPLLVLTKADLVADPELMAPQLARELGLVEAFPIAIPPRTDSSEPDLAAPKHDPCADAPEDRFRAGAPEDRSTGLPALTRELAPGDTAVLLGMSGAGKSTLANALLGHERQATQAVRAGDRRGRHTTVARELFGLPSGALLIDGPGIRRVNLWDGTGTAFADVDELAPGCRFADCEHGSEPGCAVRDALTPERLAAWRKLQREQAWVDDRRAAERERERRGRQHTRTQRAARRRKGRER